MSVQLSTDQHRAADGIYKLFSTSGQDTHSIAVLTGSAGTGKTTIVTELIKIFEKDLSISLCATTNRAATVLSEVTGATVTTAHNLFKLRPKVSKYGKETLVRAGKCDIWPRSMIVIDEASMLGDTFLKAIVDIIQSRNLKVLFVGDLYQLPPPTDKCSIFDGSLPTFTLTKVHRQKEGNPILDKAIEYRDYIAGKCFNMPELITCLNSNDEGIRVMPHETFVTNFVKKFMTYKAGEEVDAPLCTYTNDSAITYNNMIRKAAYFLEDTVAPFYPEEQLISNNIVQKNDKTILMNNEIVYVKGYSTTTYKNIPGHLVHLEGEYSKHTKSNRKDVFMPLNKSVANKVLDELKKKALADRSWTEFYEVKNSLADLRPPFAGTTHKSQGGTFTSVFIDQMNINKCQNPITRARLMYVALTRATKNVYVNQ